MGKLKSVNPRVINKAKVAAANPAAQANSKPQTRVPRFTNFPIYPFTKFFISPKLCRRGAKRFHYQALHSSRAWAFHRLLTDCTLPADGLPYMLRSSQPTCGAFISEPFISQIWPSFLNHHNI